MSDKTNNKINLDRFLAAVIFITSIWIISTLKLFSFLPDFVPMLLPRNVSALPGIISMPFLHGSFAHLMSNTFPLIIFSILISLKGNQYFLKITVLIIIISGVLLWLMGRNAYHIGASGLIFGYFGFLLLRMFYSPSLSTIIISVGVFVLYGGIIFGIFPQTGIQAGVRGENISWEGHLFGLISGIAVAKMMNKE